MKELNKMTDQLLQILKNYNSDINNIKDAEIFLLKITKGRWNIIFGPGTSTKKIYVEYTW